MFKWLGSLVDSNEKELKRLQPVIDKINNLEPEFQKLSDAELRAKTDEFKDRLKQAIATIKQGLDAELNRQEEIKARLNTAQNESERVMLQDQMKNSLSNVTGLEKERHGEEERALNELIPEAFAAVREAATRTIKQRHFDVQLLGGIILHRGQIAEMRTGEGKTLVATLPLYLNSLAGKGCHLVTVNDYLSRRDPYWMGPIYHTLGVSVASIYPQQTPDEYSPSRLYDPAYDSGKANDPWQHFRPITRKEAYLADITYGTSSEFGFDYLRDNMVADLSRCVQRELNYAIVDEVDNLLIDEARTPLIISGAQDAKGPLYVAVNNVVSRMKVKVLAHEPVTQDEKDTAAAFEEQFDYIAYEKDRYIKETAHGQEKLARAFDMTVADLFGGDSGGEQKNQTFDEIKKRNEILSIFRQSALAHSLYQRDREYVIKDGEVIIVDEFTGRLMIGRRYSEGLHQAIEAKERVKVQRESMTYATVTLQNYFRMYAKLAGMTGTAVTEAEEFHKIYKLDVTVIPTNKPMIREDFPDRIYKSEKGKFKAVVAEIEQLHKESRPVLVGTVSIEKSELLSDLLKRRGIEHRVLNAKEHTKEAEIIAQAGRPGAVTIATNMAGRGVDIILGGRPPEDGNRAEWEALHHKVIALGGLHVLGTERHEARRIDNQLRGRSGRQGDPGSSRFFVSLEDDIVRRFGGDRVGGIMNWVGMDEDTPIENTLINRAIADVQKRVEGYHFDLRKHLVEYDDVVNKHRELIYAERRKILSGADLKANIMDMVQEELHGIVDANSRNEYEGGVDLNKVIAAANIMIPVPPDFNAEALTKLKAKQVTEKLVETAEKLYEEKEKEAGSEITRLLERLAMLRTIDNLWIEHLTRMEDMRQESAWQTLRQIKAVDAYKIQGHQQFQELLATIKHDMALTIFHLRLAPQQEASTPVSRAASASGINRKPPARVSGQKVGRNDPCPCGSGKKYKHCCGK